MRAYEQNFILGAPGVHHMTSTTQDAIIGLAEASAMNLTGTSFGYIAIGGVFKVSEGGNIYMRFESSCITVNAVDLSTGEGAHGS